MALYGYNRSAFNGGVSGIVAGAALLFAAGDIQAQGVRVVLPESVVVVTSTTTAASVRTALGDGGFIVSSSLDSIPGLLQLQSAHIDVVSTLKGSNTDAWSASSGVLSSEAVLTQAGAAHAAGALVASALPLVDVGFAADVFFGSVLTADARVQLDGTTGFQVDGYASTAWAVDFSVDALRTALGYTQVVSTSGTAAESIKTHGGAANIVAAWSTTATPATDAAFSDGLSSLSAQGTVIQPGAATALGATTLQADATAILPGQSEAQVTSTLVADARLALLAQALLTANSAGTAGANRVTPGAASGAAQSSASASALVFENGFAAISAASSMTAIPALQIDAQADITATSTCRTDSLVNAGSPDPDSRVMRRQPQVRVMARAFTDRVMRRTT